MIHLHGGGMDMKNKLQQKIDDYKAFTFVAIALSGFLYIGLFIETAHEQWKMCFLIGAISILLTLSFLFVKKISQWKNELDTE